LPDGLVASFGKQKTPEALRSGVSLSFIEFA